MTLGSKADPTASVWRKASWNHLLVFWMRQTLFCFFFCTHEKKRFEAWTSFLCSRIWDLRTNPAHPFALIESHKHTRAENDTFTPPRSQPHAGISCVDGSLVALCLFSEAVRPKKLVRWGDVGSFGPQDLGEPILRLARWRSDVLTAAMRPWSRYYTSITHVSWLAHRHRSAR